VGWAKLPYFRHSKVNKWNIQKHRQDGDGDENKVMTLFSFFFSK
jgi:hypothetical protein